jgi:uncharacterized protein (DUF427 family)
MSPKRVEPGPGQESVWDYPRPPRLEAVTETLKVVFADTVIAETARGHRVLETSHPPVYYFPPEDVTLEHLVLAGGGSVCEFKGAAAYWDLRVGEKVSEKAAWSYPEIWPPYEAIRGHLAFYASRVDACFVGDERVQAQEGDFYGGWITAKVVGPFKGPPGTRGW